MIIIVLLVMNDVLNGNTKEPKADEDFTHLTINLFLNRVYCTLLLLGFSRSKNQLSWRGLLPMQPMI